MVKVLILLISYLFAYSSFGQSLFSEDLIDNSNFFFHKRSDDSKWVSSLNGINRILSKEEVQKIYPDKTRSNWIREGLIQSDFFPDGNRGFWFCTNTALYFYDNRIVQFNSYRSAKEGSYRLVGWYNPYTLLLQIDDQLFLFDCQTFEFEDIDVTFQAVRYHCKYDEEENLEFVLGAKWGFGNGVLRAKFGEEVEVDSFFNHINVRAINIIEDRLLVGSSIGLYLSSIYEEDNVKSPIQISRGKVADIKSFVDSKSIYILEDGNLYELIENELIPIDESDENYFVRLHEKDADQFILYCKNEGLVRLDLGISPFNLQSTHAPIWSISTDFEGVVYPFLQNGILANPNVIKFKNFGFNPYLIRSDSREIVVSNNGITEINASNGFFTFNQESIQGAGFYNESVIIISSEGVFKIDEDKNLEVIHQGFSTSPLVTNDAVVFSSERGLYRYIQGQEQLDFIESDLAFNTIIKGDSNAYLTASNDGIKSILFESGTLIDYELDGIYCSSLIKDLNDNLWVGTREALYFVSNIGRAKLYSKKTGLPTQSFSRNCVTSTSDGTLWWGTSDGVLSFHPDSIKDEPFNPPMLLTSLKVHGREWADDIINVEVIDEVELKYNENTLTFDFVAVDYNEYSHPQYSVFLEGYDSDTTLLGDQSIITYPNIPPGDYTFWYSACNLSGVCRDEFKPFQVSIAPPYWETWWFRSMMGLLALSIVAGGIRLYIRNRLREQQFAFEKKELELKNELQLQEERNRIADELHDELGGKLSTIKFAGKKVQKAASLEEVKSINTRVSQVSTELIDSMRSIIWAMDTHNDNLASLLANIRQYASTLGRDHELKVSFDFRIPEEEIVVKGQTRHHLYLIIKELLNNIIKHSSADMVKLNSRLLDDQLTFSVAENGQGFHPDQVSNPGKGLRSIRKRASIINATITYQQDPQMTTEINLTI